MDFTFNISPDLAESFMRLLVLAISIVVAGHVLATYLDQGER